MEGSRTIFQRTGNFRGEVLQNDSNKSGSSLKGKGLP